MIKVLWRVFSAVLSVILLLGSFGGSAAAAVNFSVGYYDYDDFFTIDEDNHITGYAGEILDMVVAANTHWNFVPVKFDRGEFLENMRKGFAAISVQSPFGSASDNPRFFTYSEYPVGTEYGVFYTDPDRDIYYEDFTAFDGMKVGSITGDMQNNLFSAYQKENDFSVEYELFNTLEEMKQALENGAIDGLIYGGVVEQADLMIIARYAETPLHVAANQWGVEAGLLEAFDRVLGSAFAGNPYFLDELYMRYFDEAPRAVQALTEEEASAVAGVADPDPGVVDAVEPPPPAVEPPAGSEDEPATGAEDEQTTPAVIIEEDAGDKRMTQIGFIVVVALLAVLIAGTLIRRSVAERAKAAKAGGKRKDTAKARKPAPYAERKAEARAQGAAKAQAKVEAKARAASEAATEAEARAAAEAQAEEEARAKAAAEAAAEAAQAEAEAETRRREQAQAQAQAEEEARAKAAAEAVAEEARAAAEAQAEEEAKAKAAAEAAEADARAAAEAQAQAEEEARAKAAAEAAAEAARAAAEAQTQAQAEEEARAKAAAEAAAAAAEAEARARAEEEARAKAAAEAAAEAARAAAEAEARKDVVDSMLGRFETLAGIGIEDSADYGAPEYTDDQIRGEIYLSGLTISLQPRYSADQNTIVGAEVSISCRHPIRDRVYPEELVGSLSQKSKLYVLDRYIFESLCMCKPQDKVDPSETFAIVVPVFTESVLQPDFSQWYIDAARSYNVPPECFRLDLIYHWQSEQDQHVYQALNELTAAGFRVALKDVGNANYPLALLSEVEMEAIVVAEQLIVDALSNDKKKRLLIALKNLCMQMDFRMEADRIDSREKLQIMTMIGCQVFQGNFLTRAIPFDQFWEYKQRLETRLVS